MNGRTMTLMTALLLVIGFAGCSSSDSPSGNDTGDPPGIQTDVTTPEAALDAHAQALNAHDFVAYQAMMEPVPPGREEAGFRFYVRDDDVGYFPWAPDGWWGYETESQIMRNMMDPEFDGEERPVESIEMQYTIINEQVVPDGRLVTVNADFTVLVAADTGWQTITRLALLLVEDADGFYRIRSIRELVNLAPNLFASTSPEELSWGSIKGLYH